MALPNPSRRTETPLSDDGCASDSSSSSESESSDSCSGDSSSSSESEPSDSCSGDSSSSSDDSGCAPTAQLELERRQRLRVGQQQRSSDASDSCCGGSSEQQLRRRHLHRRRGSGRRAHPKSAAPASRPAPACDRPRRLKTSLWSMAFAALVLPIRRRKRGRAAAVERRRAALQCRGSPMQERQSFRRQWLVPIVFLTGAALHDLLAVLHGRSLPDRWHRRCAAPSGPLSRYLSFDPTSITDAVSSLAGMIAAVFGIVITVVSHHRAVVGRSLHRRRAHVLERPREPVRDGLST